MKLKKIQPARRRLADEVYDQLLQAIQDKRVGAEDRLVQERIAADLHISRTPVREALFKLEQQGILTSSPHGGFVLRHISKTEIVDIYHARVAIEGYGARLLSQMTDGSVILKLRNQVTTIQNRDCSTVKLLFESNRDIHRAFMVATDNTFLIEMFDSLWNRYMSFQVFSGIDMSALANITQHHLTLIDAIENGTADEAMQTFQDHILEGLELQLN